MLITFRLSALGFGGTERVFLSVADFLSSKYGYSIDFVIDKVNCHETEKIATNKGYRVIGLNCTRTIRTIYPFYKYLKREKPSIVFSAYTETNTAMLISNMLNIFNTPTIVTEHAALDEHWAYRSRSKKILLELMVKYAYKYADRIICVSKGMIEQLSRRVSHPNISFIHNPVRFSLRTRSKFEARCLLSIDLDKNILIAVGRISKQKNYLMLLQAFNAMNSSGDSLLYIIGGVYEKDEKVKLDQYIEKHDLISKIFFIDFTHDVHRYYEAADVLVLSSAWEGFGNVLVEALAFGLPVVSTRCNYGPAEILAEGQFGYLVDVDDFQSMAKLIGDVITSRPFNSECQTNRALVFSESNVGENYHKLITEVLRIKKHEFV